jgi:hypothetical protein
VLRVRGDEAEPLTVALEPLGAVRGRLLDPDGKPSQGLTVSLSVARTTEDYKDYPVQELLLRSLRFGSRAPQRKGWHPDPASPDAEGKFRLDGLIPGLKYELTFIDTSARQGRRPTRAPLPVVVSAGAVKDLGDIKGRENTSKEEEE